MLMILERVTVELNILDEEAVKIGGLTHHYG